MVSLLWSRNNLTETDPVVSAGGVELDDCVPVFVVPVVAVVVVVVEVVTVTT